MRMRGTPASVSSSLRLRLDDAARNVLLVCLIAGIALTISVPNYILCFDNPYGMFGSNVDDDSHRVTSIVAGGGATGLRVGDIVQKNPYHEWILGYMPIGTVVDVPVIRDGKPLVVRVTNRRSAELDRSFGPVWAATIQVTASLLLVLLGASLALLRPTRLTWPFFLYAAGLGGKTEIGPAFWSFLPAFPATVVLWLYFLSWKVATIAFVVFALRLTAVFPPRLQLLIERAVIGAAIPFFAIDATWTALYFARPAYDAGFLFVIASSILAVIWTLGIAIFSWAIVRKIRTGNGISILASTVFAASGIVFLCYQLTNGLVNFPASISDAIAGHASVLYFPLSIAGAYIIVRRRTLDVRLAITRAGAFAALGYLIIAAGVCLNWAFAKQLAQYAFLIPLEIMVAVWLGYWLSGLRDISGTLALATSEASFAGLRGDRVHEREIFAKALGRAEYSRKPSLIAEVRARAAFSAWLAGEDDECERNLAALEVAIGSAPSRGLGFLVAAARDRLPPGDPSPSDLAEWISRGALIASARAGNTASALLYARQAALAADRAGQPFLQLLAAVATSEVAPFGVEAAQARAVESAADLRVPAIENAVRALVAGGDPGILAPFVGRFRKSPVPEAPPLAISFLSAEVRLRGAVPELRDSERALLFALAHRPGPISTDALVDSLWPERDGDAARNAFRVCLHRLRRGLGETEFIKRSNAGYALSAETAVDLHTLPNPPRPLDRPLEANDRLAYRSAYERLNAHRGARETAGAWFERYALELRDRLDSIGRLLAKDALRRGDADEALAFVEALLAEDRTDQEACEMLIAAHLLAGDRITARREFEAYRKVHGTAQRPVGGPTIEALLNDFARSYSL
jgi:DNA-binding SARP family transcriptional activator